MNNVNKALVGLAKAYLRGEPVLEKLHEFVELYTWPAPSQLQTAEAEFVGRLALYLEEIEEDQRPVESLDSLLRSLLTSEPRLSA